MICPSCNKDFDKLTRDHIIPRWLFNPTRLNELGLRDKRDKWGHFIQAQTRMICSDCNNKKGGKLDYTDPIVRKFVKKLVFQLQKGLEENEPDGILLVKCLCHETNSPRNA